MLKQVSFIGLFTLIPISIFCFLYQLDLLPEDVLSQHVPWQRALREAGVPENEFVVCMEWAFGDDALDIELRCLPDRWRDLHPELFIIHDSDYAYKVLYKVGKAYMDDRETER